MNETLTSKEVGVVITGLLLVGGLLKNAFPSFPNRFIPLLTWILGVPSFLALSAAGAWTDPAAWTNAALLCASATGIHSGLKNSLVGDVPAPRTLSLMLSLSASALLLGCVALRPGADPLVVRTEQTLQTAGSTFDLVLRLDHSDRGFWRTNAPGFHNFCEWLRAPLYVTPPGTNLARALALQLQLDTVKREYKAARANSSDVLTALSTLQSALNQAGAWAGVITNR